jgi:hypothetical protein
MLLSGCVYLRFCKAFSFRYREELQDLGGRFEESVFHFDVGQNEVGCSVEGHRLNLRIDHVRQNGVPANNCREGDLFKKEEKRNPSRESRALSRISTAW